ncbi:PAS domain S-box protein [Comamonadaceae bacterium G21597-S1]|nr:PAS domain S-box protein [Comamonadaceae bacterium G21597-S1]
MNAASGRPGESSSATRRWVLWGALVVLVAALLVTLVWLAGRYEAGRLQDRIERDAVEVVADIRGGMTRNVQSLQALPRFDPQYSDPWTLRAGALLRARREMLRIELRDARLQLQAAVDSDLRAAVFDAPQREQLASEVEAACQQARSARGPIYATSPFRVAVNGQRQQLLELCLPLGGAGETYLVVTYALGEILNEMVAEPFARAYDVAFSDLDGTRVAFHGVTRSGNRTFSAQIGLDLPGYALVLRLDSWRGTPALFPNFLTAMVVAMAIGLVVVLVFLGRDMRRRLRAEHELADALAFRKAMEDSLVTGLRARDLDGRTTYVNPAFCQMVGFSAQELIQAGTAVPYWPVEQYDEYQERLQSRLQGRQPPREGFESVFVRKDGSRFPVLIIEAPLINAQGTQTGWMTAFLDISEQRRIEEMSRASRERLQATARLATIGEMASLLSHELNQPLAAIASYANGSINMLHNALPAAASPLDGDAAVLPLEETRLVEEGLHHIADQAQRAGKIIKSVHDFVRRRERLREVVPVRDLFDAILPLIELQARKVGVRCHVRAADDLPSLLCDRTMVEQVLLNLARNAMQAMDQVSHAQRQLVLQARRAPSSERTAHAQGWLELSVTDTGTGIPPEVSEKLFTPFFTTKDEGMGLGLSLCRTVVEQHGGFLAYGPNQPQGMVFRFTLPLAPVSGATAADLGAAGEAAGAAALATP